MFSHLQKEGLYDQTHRARFTNIDDEDFVGTWDSKVYVRVPPGESVTLPESQAINFGIALATKVMLKDEKRRFVPNMMEPTWEMSQRSRVGIPDARKAYEDQIIHWLVQGEETPELQALRSQLRDEVLQDLQATVSTEAPKGPTSKDQLSVVADPKRPDASGKEFEGLSSLT